MKSYIKGVTAFAAAMAAVMGTAALAVMAESSHTGVHVMSETEILR